jgi:hypothetical protein
LFVEWIPIEDLTEPKLIDEKGIFSAIWKKGLPRDFQENKLIREEGIEVTLKQLPENMDFESSAHIFYYRFFENLIFFFQIRIHLKAKRTGYGIVPCYRITHYGNRYTLVLMKMDNTLENYLEKRKKGHQLSNYEIDNFLHPFVQSP